MALLKCEECDGNVSSFAECCPHCGYPVKRMLKGKERTIVHSHFGQGEILRVENGKIVIRFDCDKERKSFLLGGVKEEEKSFLIDGVKEKIRFLTPEFEQSFWKSVNEETDQRG